VAQEQHRTIATPSRPSSTVVPPADEVLNRVMIIMARFITCLTQHAELDHRIAIDAGQHCA